MSSRPLLPMSRAEDNIKNGDIFVAIPLDSQANILLLQQQRPQSDNSPGMSYGLSLTEPLLQENNKSSSSNSNKTKTPVSSPSRCTTMRQLMPTTCVGALVGLTSSIVGFLLQPRLLPLSTASTLSMAIFALVWSGVTSLLCYLCFCSCFLRKTNNNKNRVSSSSSSPLQLHPQLFEYSFALGSFWGFCVGCTATDLVLGMPLSSIGVTVGVAMIWTGIMLQCAASNSSTDEEDDEEGTSDEEGGS